MDELRDQIRRLGEAAQADVAPIDPSELTAVKHPTRIDTDTPAAPAEVHSSRRSRMLSRRAVLGAAAALFVALGSLTLIARSMPEDAVGVASAQVDAIDREVPDDDNGWAELRFCESSSDYTADTGNTFHGAYQFTRQAFAITAGELGLTDVVSINPASASPEIQDAVANALYLERGAEAWPICGEFLRGPMVTPVVPQWLSANRFIGSTVVFIDADVSEVEIDEILEQLSDAIGEGATSPIRFVSKEEAFEEFQSMFAGDRVTSSVRAQDMPPRFEFSGPISTESTDRLNAISGVFEVFTGVPEGVATLGPLHISIPAIGIDEPVYPTATTEHLEAGLAVVGDATAHTIIGGFGSVKNGVFESLDELRTGDVVILSSRVASNDRSYEISQEFTVDHADADNAPPIMHLDEIAKLQPSPVPQIILVADVADDAALRLIVRATPAPADPNRYIVVDDQS